MKTSPVTVSIVIPAYNEAGNLAELHRQIVSVCQAQGYTYEIILVDDGSVDQTPEIARTLLPLVSIRFRRNFGQTAAMDAGIKHARYEYIVTMDADLQNDPADIPRLLAHLLAHDLDAVCGWRKRRSDPFFKRLISRGAQILRRVLVQDGIHDSGCSLRIYRRECFSQVSLYGEMHRFIPALLRIKGFRLGEIEVNHRRRYAGVTKYNWRRTIKGFLDMVGVWFWHKYSVKPLHLLGGMGLCVLAAGGVTSIYTILYFIANGDVGNTVWPLLSAFLILTGIQLFVSGLLSEILTKSYYETTRDTPYSIREIITQGTPPLRPKDDNR